MSFVFISRRIKTHHRQLPEIADWGSLRCISFVFVIKKIHSFIIEFSSKYLHEINTICAQIINTLFDEIQVVKSSSISGNKFYFGMF